MVCCSVHLPYLRHVQMEKYTIHADENGSICFWETRCDVYIPFDNGQKRERENENGKKRMKHSTSCGMKLEVGDEQKNESL